ncbi:MAG: hypothetical protein ACKPKO_55685, partial [Candidatus Fonsibacter sp.]
RNHPPTQKHKKKPVALVAKHGKVLGKGRRYCGEKGFKGSAGASDDTTIRWRPSPWGQSGLHSRLSLLCIDAWTVASWEAATWQ